jgi:hypothetical protein
MDEANIVSVLQEDLQNYKVKPQIRRKESQLHVLITRAEGDDLDYGAIYDIVKRRIDSLAIDGAVDEADNLIVYGRLAGARHPEWQKTGEIKLPLPLIELDLDDLENLGDIGNITFPIAASDLEIAASQNLNLDQGGNQLGNQINNPLNDPFDDQLTAQISDQLNGQFNGQSSDGQSSDSQSSDGIRKDGKDGDDEYNTFKNSIANDLATASQLNANDLEDPFDHDFGQQPTAIAAVKNLEALGNSLDLSTLSPEVILPNIDNDITLGQEPANMKLNADFNLEATTVAMPRPLPPPPTRHKRAKGQDPNHDVKKEQKESAPEKIKKPLPKLPLVSIAVASGAIAILGICGWLIWDRSTQQSYLETARNLENQNLNPATIKQVDQLITSRNQIQTAIAQLQTIPDRPVSLYGTAQSEIANLQPKLKAFDQRVELEQEANKNLELGKNMTLEAAKLTLNAPHHSKVWKSGQAKRQEALKVLQQIPPDSLIYADVQARIKTYGNELNQISKWVDIQQRAESTSANVSPEVINQLKQIKTKATDKSQFINQCRPLLQRQITASDAQRLGMSLDNLNGYLCAYFWE